SAAEKPAEAAQPKAAAQPAPAAEPQKTATAEPAPAVESASEPSEEKRVKASPLAKSMAKDAGIDIAKVQGSGDHGRIVRKDVEAFLETKEAEPAAAPDSYRDAAEPKAPAPAPAPAAPAFVYPCGEAFEDKPLSQMRKTIARRLGESKFSAPHFYLTMEINMDNAVAARQRINELAAPVKISFNDIVVKAVAVALRQHPAVNSAWLGDKIRTNQHIHIGVAVAVDEGLLVPVIRHADIKSLTQINQETKFYAEKARSRKLQPEEMTGSTFSVSNLGMFDIDEFTAIINPPEACILAVGSISQKPIVKDGQIVIGNMMKVTLSCDHRAVDGATGSKFLQTLKGILEEPLLLLV
ncbi:MAG: dihydrolipoamide acetyltransferase family protein, partial [Bacteroidota bacterium]